MYRHHLNLPRDDGPLILRQLMQTNSVHQKEALFPHILRAKLLLMKKVNPMNCQENQKKFSRAPKENQKNVLFLGDVLLVLPKSLFSDLSGYIFYKNDQFFVTVLLAIANKCATIGLIKQTKKGEDGIWKNGRKLTLSGLQHFAFCRRQWALIFIEQQWQENLRTAEGNAMHRRAHDETQFERRGDTLVVRGLRVASERLNVTGVCDVVEFHESTDGVALYGQEGRWAPYPVEYKRGAPKGA